MRSAPVVSCSLTAGNASRKISDTEPIDPHAKNSAPARRSDGRINREGWGGMTTKINRRKIIGAMATGTGAAMLPLPWVSKMSAWAAGEPIVLGVPTCQTAAAGVADDLDHLNGTTLAMEEINAAGGILGRPLKLFVTDVDKLSPESCQQAIAAFVAATGPA